MNLDSTCAHLRNDASLPTMASQAALIALEEFS
jgi:hypothetical protein